GWFGGGRYSRLVDRSFDVAPDAQLAIRSSSVDVSLVPGSGTTLHVHGTFRGSSRAQVDGVHVTMQQSGNRRIVAIEVPSGRFEFVNFTDAHVIVSVPRVAALAVVSTSGDLSAADQSAPLDVQTSSGDVTVDRAKAAVAIRTSSGDVIVRQAAGTVRTDTTSGDVHVRDPGGSLSSTSTSGDLTATLGANWSGSSLAMHSTSGDIDLTVPSSFHGALHTSTASGDVANNAKLTPNGTIPVDLTSSSGDITVH
ncbi:MAG: DUF4097 domain-containing protein, partial [Candidatus Eremiobacteraeota bacterium]|nr:DUF4097 domain-containing protein [Candidatus Eremiobacteraeota bacterium]